MIRNVRKGYDETLSRLDTIIEENSEVIEKADRILAKHGHSEVTDTPEEKHSRLQDALEQVILGNFTDKVTTEGTIAQVLLGLTGLDLPADVRDVSADLINWEWTWGHAGQTTLDGIGLVPIVGVLKSGDEVYTLVKGANKLEKPVADEVTDLEKSANRLMGGCNCFTAGTKVFTDEGEKNIEDIQVGDRVLSKDEETGEVAYKEVTATFNHETDEIYKIHVGDQVIESTFNHPFYVEGKGWTFVKDLKVGDLLVQSDGNTLKIESIELEHKQVTVYNMTVDDFHTYFVSDLEIWVHNTNCYDGFRNFDNHYDKHVLGKNGGAREYGDDFTKPDYYNLAYDLATSKVDGVNIIERYQGSTKVIYNRGTNDMVYVHSDGTIGSLYKPKFGSSAPDAGYNYFVRITTANP